MDQRRIDLYLTILQRALLNIRHLGTLGRASDCAIEADHVHNIPELLSTRDPGKERYYWDVERVSYMGQAKESQKSVFEPIWDEIAILDLAPNVYTLQVPILGENGSVLRPVAAIKVGSNRYQILPGPGCELERPSLEFPPGTIVECDTRTDCFPQMLVAVRRVE